MIKGTMFTKTIMVIKNSNDQSPYRYFAGYGCYSHDWVENVFDAVHYPLGTNMGKAYRSGMAQYGRSDLPEDFYVETYDLVAKVW